eukprot:CAMPEP_0195524734 /NCGR_PEP_ID=MMETSP0794_2-20130614/24749_1 /TAXON_ID=515487 /ORGANISM="Stephanopyxis turris, Strain CCMP 815" /LENGTH=307 /DNA_ID=CAMNT_0040655021 /DNA_START=146 /DNA_END=1069 /DNA_ORIENTATION=-
MTCDVPENSGNSQQSCNSITGRDSLIPSEQEVQQQFESQNRNENRFVKAKKIILAVVLVGFFVFVTSDFLTNKSIEKGFHSFLYWVGGHPGPGVFAFMAVYFLATVLFFPVSFLTLGGGFVFANAFGLGIGFVLAVTAVFFGASLGAVVSFVLGRYLLRDWVETLIAKHAVFAAIDKVMEDKGLRVLVLLHLSPIVPFNALNYISGTTAVTLRTYSFALLAILPGTMVYVFLGGTAGSLADSTLNGTPSYMEIVLIVLGVTFGLTGIAIVSRFARIELNKITSKQDIDGTLSRPAMGDLADEERSLT